MFYTTFVDPGPLSIDTRRSKYTEEEMTDALDFVLRSSRVPYTRNTTSGETPLHVACDWRKVQKIEVILKASLIGNNNIDVYEQDNRGRTPLHIACDHVINSPWARGWDRLGVMLKYAKKIGLDLERTDFNGRTPCHYLCKSCTKKEVK